MAAVVAEEEQGFRESLGARELESAKNSDELLAQHNAVTKVSMCVCVCVCVCVAEALNNAMLHSLHSLLRLFFHIHTHRAKSGHDFPRSQMDICTLAMPSP